MTPPSTLPNRREMLGITAGGLLTTGMFSQAAGAENQRPVRVAVIGTGARGSDLIRSLTTIQGIELVALADDYPPHLERAQGRRGQCRAGRGKVRSAGAVAALEAPPNNHGRPGRAAARRVFAA